MQSNKTAMRAAFEDALNQQVLSTKTSDQKETKTMDNSLQIFAPAPELADATKARRKEEVVFYAVKANPGGKSKDYSDLLGFETSPSLSRLLSAGFIKATRVPGMGGVNTYEAVLARFNVGKLRTRTAGKSQAKKPANRKEPVKPMVASRADSVNLLNARQIVSTMPAPVAKEVYLELKKLFD